MRTESTPTKLTALEDFDNRWSLFKKETSMKKAISTLGFALAIGVPALANAVNLKEEGTALRAEDALNNRIAISGAQISAPPSNNIDIESSITNVTNESITLEGMPSTLTEQQETRVQSFAAESEASAQVFDPAYTPACTELAIGTVYTLSGTATGSSYCYYFPVTSETVRIDAVLINQLANSDHDITVAQDDPNNPYTFPIVHSSTYTGNSDERVSFISDAGHYYLFIDTYASTGEPFNIAFQAIENFDEYEINDTLATATALTYSETVTGNIDTGYDEDYYSYTAESDKITVEVIQDDNIHDMYVSYDEGVTWSTVNGSGRFEPTVEPGDVITFGVIRGDSLNPANPYSITVYDNRGLKVNNLTNLIINLHSSSGQNYLNKTLGNYRVDGVPITGGVKGHYVRFFGILWLTNGEPAPYADFTFDYTLAKDGIGHWYHEVSANTDGDGFFEILLPLNECLGLNSYTQRVPGSDPDINYIFDLETFHIRAETLNGEQVMNTANEYFFNLCAASPGADILDPL